MAAFRAPRLAAAFASIPSVATSSSAGLWPLGDREGLGQRPRRSFDRAGLSLRRSVGDDALVLPAVPEKRVAMGAWDALASDVVAPDAPGRGAGQRVALRGDRAPGGVGCFEVNVARVVADWVHGDREVWVRLLLGRRRILDRFMLGCFVSCVTAVSLS